MEIIQFSAEMARTELNRQRVERINEVLGDIQRRVDSGENTGMTHIIYENRELPSYIREELTAQGYTITEIEGGYQLTWD